MGSIVCAELTWYTEEMYFLLGGPEVRFVKDSLTNYIRPGDAGVVFH